MASSRAQEEKNAKAIRELMKLPANKQCFDCGQKGPVYANCSIGTFICTTCSGVHRELSHRCKSVSMSTFTSAEVEKLTTIGNENAQKEWHASWNPSEYPAPDGNDTSYLKKFLYMTYQERKFSAAPAKGSDNGTSPGSNKLKKKASTVDKVSKKESKKDLPKPEPLSNILGPNIPSIDVGSSHSSKSPRQKDTTPKNEAPLINLLDDSPIMPAGGSKPSSNSSSSSLMGDLMSLSVAPQPTYTANPFGAANTAPAVDPQQLAALQNQVQQMQNAIMSAKSQMMAAQEQIQRGQAVFAQLTPQQREQLSGLMQRYQAMSTQFTAMNQQHSAAAAKLQQMQQMQAAAAPPASSSNNMFAAFGAPPANTSTMPSTSMYGGMSSGGFPPVSTPSNPSLYGSTPQTHSSSSSSNLFAAQPAYTNPAPASNSNPFPGSYSAAPTSNGNSHSSHDLFAAYGSAQHAQPAQPMQHTGYGAPMSFSSAPGPKNTDFHPFG